MPSLPSYVLLASFGNNLIISREITATKSRNLQQAAGVLRQIALPHFAPRPWQSLQPLHGIQRKVTSTYSRLTIDKKRIPGQKIPPAGAREADCDK